MFVSAKPASIERESVMAGWMVGALLLNWILCSALNAFIESRVMAGRIERRLGFSVMVGGLLLVLVAMLLICLVVYPQSAQATTLFLTQEQALPSARVSAGINVLFVLAYAGFQLRRFWDDT